MDIFRFIDSADIRRYLAEIRYRFSTEEKMFLIWYCKAATLNEKIAAWQEIVGYALRGVAHHKLPVTLKEKRFSRLRHIMPA